MEVNRVVHEQPEGRFEAAAAVPSVMSNYSRNAFAVPVPPEDGDAPPTGSRILAGFDIALTVWLVAVIGLGLVTRSVAHGMPFNDYTDYSTYGSWVGFNASLSKLLYGTLGLEIPVTILMVIGSVVALVGVRRDPRTFRVLLAATIALRSVRRASSRTVSA
jgi:hypothetical protein